MNTASPAHTGWPYIAGIIQLIKIMRMFVRTSIRTSSCSGKDLQRNSCNSIFNKARQKYGSSFQVAAAKKAFLDSNTG
jgi:hypothetical protein